MSVSSLSKAIALHNLLVTLDAPETGVSLRRVERQWPRTGLRAGDLRDALKAADATEDFEVVYDRGAPRVRIAGFDDNQLNPSTLPEIEALESAYAQLERLQKRRPIGRVSVRRTSDTSR